MKSRLLTGWSIRRVVYLVMGIMIMVQAWQAQQWILSVLGGYFATMGLFALGCAGSNCEVNMNSKKQYSKNRIEKIEFEEVK
ncbi:MAG: hypothetical protein MUC49_05930 [Raineya sp.]|jgi:hypothetical protein|nr:hypothetical protein [Raineya sp.]